MFLVGMSRTGEEVLLDECLREFAYFPFQIFHFVRHFGGGFSCASFTMFRFSPRNLASESEVAKLERILTKILAPNLSFVFDLLLFALLSRCFGLVTSYSVGLFRFYFFVIFGGGWRGFRLSHTCMRRW